jgi:hypothetical protein
LEEFLQFKSQYLISPRRPMQTIPFAGIPNRVRDSINNRMTG